jgi:hypothetical protein
MPPCVQNAENAVDYSMRYFGTNSHHAVCRRNYNLLITNACDHTVSEINYKFIEAVVPISPFAAVQSRRFVNWRITDRGQHCRFMHAGSHGATVNMLFFKRNKVLKIDRLFSENSIESLIQVGTGIFFDIFDQEFLPGRLDGDLDVFSADRLQRDARIDRQQ